MGTVIKSVAISPPSYDLGSIAHASAAAAECMKTASVLPHEIDLILNVGIFRDQNMVEPAMAALIQKELGINLDLVKFPTQKPTFSFDLMNGACGVLNAVQVADALLASHPNQNVLIVSSDAHPSNRKIDGFPYASAGAAFILQKSPRQDQGFGRVQFLNSPQESWGRIASSQIYHKNSQEIISVIDDSDYLPRLQSLMADSIRRYTSTEDLILDRILLLITQPCPEFAENLAKDLKIARASVLTIPGIDLDLGTSALGFAYHKALQSGALQEYDQVLFAAVGAGMTSACAAYRT